MSTPRNTTSIVFKYPAFFFFNDTATTEIYTLSLHDALPIYFFTAQRNQQNPPFATAVTNVQTSSSAPIPFAAPWSVGTFTTNPFPQPAVPTPSQALFFAQSQYIVTVPQFKPAYAIQWTLSVQREFGHGWQGQLGYIGNVERADP